MKKRIYALLGIGAALLALAGCRREDPALLSQEANEVKTQFVFNISTNTAQTKQTADAAQASGNAGKFWGISNAMFLTYALSTDNQILKTDAAATKLYDLAKLMNATDAGSFNPRRVLEMSLPLNTNTVLFYGKAPDVTSGTYSGFEPKDYFGALDPTDGYKMGTAVGSANFQLCRRLTDKTGFYAMEKLLAGIMTVIMNTSLTVAAGTHTAISATAVPTNGNTYPYGFAFITSTADPTAVGYYPEIHWYDYSGTSSPVETGHALYPLEEKLSRLYKQMTSVYTNEGELRAGSADAILGIITDLWSVINSVRCANPLCPAEAIAKFFAERVHLHLQDYFSGTYNGTGLPITGVGFRNMTDICSDFILDKFWPNNTAANAQKPSGTKTEGGDFTGDYLTLQDYLPTDFPDKFGVFPGAAYMTYDATNHFYKYPKYFNTSEVGGTPYDPTSETGYTAEDYFYPAQLIYFGNSPLRTSDLEHQTNDYPATNANWVDDTKWAAETGGKTDWTGTAIHSTTHSVAMKNLIHYGVAMLETRVGYTDAALDKGYIYDNNHAVQYRDSGTNEDDRRIDIKTAGTFKLTGVIIGGQREKVDWDFLPKAGAKEGFIYDKAVVNGEVQFNDGSKTPSGSGETSATPFNSNYTVVFDNYVNGGPQEAVYVALEFENNSGQGIFGNYNLIPDKGKFYLIGELPIAGKTLSSWPIEVPPYNYTGVGNSYVGVPRIFIQGYKTTVTFKLSTKSLQAAYLTVPDLRASSLTLGLSVDIDWKQGLDYPEVVIGPEDPATPTP